MGKDEDFSGDEVELERLLSPSKWYVVYILFVMPSSGNV